jgi:STE24 endopeptidase
MTIRILAAGLLLLLGLMLPATAQEGPPRAAPTAHVESSALPAIGAPAYDADAATDKYLSRVSGEARARSDSYTEGGHALLLLDLAYALVVAGLLLWLQISARLRDWAEDRTRSRTYQVMLYAVVYVAIMAAADLPLAIYEGFIREHSYGLSNQSFMAWLGDYGISVAVLFVVAVVFLPILYSVIRAARETWWIWGAGVTILFSVIWLVITPVFIAPLYNHYSPLADGPLKHDIQSLARANGVPADDVWVADESRQSNRLSANVAGFLGTTRIALNDNLLEKGTHDEVMAVLGHEMGHYVLGHTTRLLLLMALVTILGFAFLNFGFRFATGVFGGNWQVREVSDIAGLPLLAALSATFMTVMTPATSTISRTTESQADIFGVNAVRKPDAFATTVLKLSTYRKLDPGPWEEAIFYDHPSGRTRIHAMMVWKAAHAGDADILGSTRLP